MDVPCPTCGTNLTFDIQQTAWSEYPILDVYVHKDDPRQKYVHMSWDQIDVHYGDQQEVRLFCPGCGLTEYRLEYDDCAPDEEDGFVLWRVDEAFDD